MKKILLIDDSKTIISSLKIDIDLLIHDIEILIAYSFSEASNIIRRHKDDIFIAVVDLALPDCDDGKAVLLTLSHKIPTIVLTANDDVNLKKVLLEKEILDYIRKDSPNAGKYIANLISKIIRNSLTTALVVDDSQLFRDAFAKDLKKLHINVLEAKDGQEALDIMEDNEQNVSLILTDYNMPNVDGIELTSKLREKYDKDSLSIIALSATDDNRALSEFIKAGANDFITKPHKFEELNVRVNSNLDILDLFQKTKDLANKDFLTGSYNRRYFFEASEMIVAKNVRKDSPVAVATLDIDHFKRVNDTHGHDVGDVAIQEIAKVLDKTLRDSDLAARFGGEEYCILLEDISEDDTFALFEKIRLNFEENEIKIDELTLKYTVSLGVAYGKCNDINELIKVSDNALYEAKDNGRNRVIIHNT
ncbi:MAG: diguanylate cyclase [Helicobacteraceae bacterium]|nr:diguanylate cyclase [Helicobacteraceae bacterium]